MSYLLITGTSEYRHFVHEGWKLYYNRSDEPTTFYTWCGYENKHIVNAHRCVWHPKYKLWKSDRRKNETKEMFFERMRKLATELDFAYKHHTNCYGKMPCYILTDRLLAQKQWQKLLEEKQSSDAC